MNLAIFSWEKHFEMRAFLCHSLGK